MARPTKCTEEVMNIVCKAVEEGNFLVVAASAAGIDEATLHRWMRTPREPYLTFRQLVIAAETAGEMCCVQQLKKAATDDPRHYAWFLERKYPERWGRKDRMQLAGDPKAPVVYEIHVIYEDQPTSPSESDEMHS